MKNTAQHNNSIHPAISIPKKSRLMLAGHRQHQRNRQQSMLMRSVQQIELG